MRLCRAAKLHLCADGGANRVYDEKLPSSAFPFKIEETQVFGGHEERTSLSTLLSSLVLPPVPMDVFVASLFSLRLSGIMRLILHQTDIITTPFVSTKPDYPDDPVARHDTRTPACYSKRGDTMAFQRPDVSSYWNFSCANLGKPLTNFLQITLQLSLAHLLASSN
ncbi:hypothetical protein CJ030_MR8G002042 [Morella rubra]|uniref:Uncharacterized protein n=1 Tax=Morella rubra TaxID=262757 RepID=A0A6A1URS5_9ROSI|nr:hypothetical protein CJ030_MR8G002042 [Morella rubra]